ncbi:hypothetical protein ACIQC0_00870 [Pseudarthrobacter sp. NPDC092419]|uniref:hypothetical protein n=1 Tax=Pseudarthrobacter sp. NPDC092419 TaxID=3364414 RepID=UPI00380AEFAF
MTPSQSALRAMSASASAAVLALSVSLSAGGAAAADSPDATTSPDCGESCLGTESRPGEGRGKNKETPGPPAPAEPAPPEAPAPQGPEVDPVPATPATVPAPPPATAAPAKTATPSPSHPGSAEPSTESNWDTPYTRSARPTEAALSRVGGSGGPDPLNITAGGMLVGISAAAFAWYGRNRVRAH